MRKIRFPTKVRTLTTGSIDQNEPTKAITDGRVHSSKSYCRLHQRTLQMDPVTSSLKQSERKRRFFSEYAESGDSHITWTEMSRVSIKDFSSYESRTADLQIAQKSSRTSICSCCFEDETV